jgi:hypothetical protein
MKTSTSRYQSGFTIVLPLLVLVLSFIVGTYFYRNSGDAKVSLKETVLDMVDGVNPKSNQTTTDELATTTQTTDDTNTTTPGQNSSEVSGSTSVSVGVEKSWYFKIPNGAPDPTPYKVCWGDGTCGYSGTVVFYQKGGGTASILHTYWKAGTYVINATVGSATYTYNVTVTAPAESSAIKNDTGLTFTVNTYKQVTFSLEGAAGTVTWNYQQNPVPGLSFSQPASPGFACLPGQPCPYTPPKELLLGGRATKAGTYTTVLSVRDGAGKTATRTLTIVVE